MSLLNFKIKNKKIRKAFKLALSLFIIYHLAMILIAPHRMSLIHETLMPYFTPYAHTLSMVTSWDFYAPKPSYYFYFEYEVIDSKDKVGTFRWPPSRKESNRIYLNHNRLIYHSRFFMFSGKKNIRKYFIPYLCQLHPRATEISIKALMEDRPHFKKARTFEPGFFSESNMNNMKEWFTVSSKCKNHKKSRKIDSLDASITDEDFSSN